VAHDLAAIAPVRSLSWTGNVVVAGTDDRCLRSWDASNGQLLATIIADQNRLSIINANGHYRAESETDSELIYVAQTASGQQTYTPQEFSAKFNWKNVPQVKFTAR
jgi:hypothetical protein